MHTKQTVNRLRRQIKKRIPETEEENADNLVNELENPKHDSSKLSKTMKSLSIKIDSTKVIKDGSGHRILNQDTKANYIKDYFEKQFKDPDYATYLK